MFSLSTANSALRASQTALEVVAQNIANANTPDYHRQAVRLQDRRPLETDGHYIGTGVDVSQISRIRSELTETALTRNISEQSSVSAQLDLVRQIESLLVPDTGSLHDQVQRFFNSLQQLSANPADGTKREGIIRNADSLAKALNEYSRNLDELSRQLESQVGRVINEINRSVGVVADLNARIDAAEARGLTPNDLLDRRDQTLNETADLIDVRSDKQGKAQSVVLLADASVLVGHRPVELRAETGAAGDIVVTQTQWDTPLSVKGGKLAGLLTARNEIIPQYRTELTEFTRAFVDAIDTVHATGVGLRGPFELLTGRRSVSDVGIPLAETQTSFPVVNGELFIAVTDLSNGQRTLQEIAIDPASQSLQDIAAAISTVDRIQALADSQKGTLTVVAETGFAFDFTGHLETLPDTAAMTGSSIAELQGSYVGTDNDQLIFQLNGSGTVGVTPGVTLDVFDSGGRLMASYEVGQGYEPGSPLATGLGVFVSLSPGTVNAGDTFSTSLVARPDTTDILRAVGLNTLFVGSDANDVRVNPTLLEDRDRLATSRTGQPGNGDNLTSMISVRDTLLFDDGRQSAESYLSELVSNVGSRVAGLQTRQSNLELLGDRLRLDRESVSGVDPNEELVQMLQAQRSFQAAARYIATIDETLDDLFSILR